MNKEKQQAFERVRVEKDELREKIGKLKDLLKSENSTVPLKYVSSSFKSLK